MYVMYVTGIQIAACVRFENAAATFAQEKPDATNGHRKV